MSIAVSLERLREEIANAGSSPFLLTTSSDGRPHCVAVSVRWHGDDLEMAVGSRTATNASDRPLVSLLWPPAEPGGYSLIVDAEAYAPARTTDASPEVSGRSVTVRPTRAVLHRPAAQPVDERRGACGADCVPLLRS